MSESDEDRIMNEPRSKKRKKTGRVADVMKKLRLQPHELGPDCLNASKT